MIYYAPFVYSAAGILVSFAIGVAVLRKGQSLAAPLFWLGALLVAMGFNLLLLDCVTKSGCELAPATVQHALSPFIFVLGFLSLPGIIVCGAAFSGLLLATLLMAAIGQRRHG